MPQPLVFVCYSHQDQAEKDQLLTHLNQLRQAGYLKVWTKDDISAGANVDTEIDQAIDQARLAILFLTANFFADDDIITKTIPKLLTRQKQDGLTIIPVLAKACAWNAFDWLDGREVFSGGRPIWGDRNRDTDRALTKLNQVIAKTVGLSIKELPEIEKSKSPIERVIQALKSNFTQNPSDLPPLFVQVPAMPNHFIGRNEMLGTLISRLTSGETLALSAEGLGGVGKTMMAVALAHHQEILSHFKDGVLWARLGPQAGESEVMSTLATWATALRQDISSLTDLAECKQLVKQLIGQRTLLLVIDDVWELELVQALRCGGPNCCHLLTTRNKGIAQQFAGAANAQNVTSLEEGPAYVLLQALAPDACKVDPETSRELAQAVGGLPLALKLLGGYLSNAEGTLFPEMFGDLTTKALTKVSDPKQRLKLAQKRLGTNKKMSLRDMLALSLDELAEEDQAAFYALGAFAPKPEYFSLAAVEAVTQAEDETLARLAVRNLVEVEGKQFALHQVLADVAKEEIDETVTERHRTYYMGLANEDPKDWRRIEAVYGQIKWAWQATTDDESRLDWIWALRTYQQLRGLWRDQLDWYEIGLAAAKALERRKAEGDMLNNVGMVYRQLRQDDDALENFRQAFSIFEEIKDWQAMAVALNNAGLVYHDLEQYHDLLNIFRKAFSTFKVAGNLEGILSSLNNIGGIHRQLEQNGEALEIYEKALEIARKGGKLEAMATILNNIGETHRQLEQNDEALNAYLQALSISEEVGDRYIESIIRYNMAIIYLEEGYLYKAEIQLKIAAKLSEQVQSSYQDQAKALLAQVQAELKGTDR